MISTESVTYRHDLNDEEKLILAKQLVEEQLALSDFEDERKAAASEFKSKIETSQERIKLLSRNIRDWYMMKTMYCEKVKNLADKVWEYVDPENGRTVKTEPLAATDYQEELY